MVRGNTVEIYTITHIKSGKTYIGSTKVASRKRWAQHRCYLRMDKHVNEYLQRAWNKYGEDAFEFKVIDKCDIDNIWELETEWINKFKEVYNIAVPGPNPMCGRKFTEEHKMKLRKINGTPCVALKDGIAVYADSYVELGEMIGVSRKGVGCAINRENNIAKGWELIWQK